MTAAIDDLPDTAEYPEFLPAPELVDVDQAAAAPAAPRGTRADGQPRRKPGPPKGSPARGGRRTATRKAPGAGGSFPAPPKKATPNTAASSAPTKDYATGVASLLAWPQGILTGIGLIPGQEAWLADSAAISMFTPHLAGAAAQFAADNPSHTLVAWLDKAISIGPYAMFGTAAIGFLAQCAVNHGMLPPGMLGTLSPKLLAAKMRIEAQAQAAHMEAQLREQERIAAHLAEQFEG